MVLKNPSVLWCLLPPRHAHARTNEKPDPNSPDPAAARDDALDAPPSPPPVPPIPDGGIGESPVPPTHRPKRSSFTTFFAFGSKRKSTHSVPLVYLPPLQPDLRVPVQTVPGKWVSDRARSQVHLIEPATVPSPLRADDDEYHYAYYAAVSPSFPSHPSSPIPDVKRVSSRPQKPDTDSQLSPSVDSHPSHSLFQHPYAYSTPLDPKPSVGISPQLRHTTSQPFQHPAHGPPSDVSARPAHRRMLLPPHEHQTQSRSLHSQLRTSLSTPNLASRSRSLAGTKPSRSKERWLSAETWWDALFSPSPRLRVKQAPRLHAASSEDAPQPTRSPAKAELRSALGVTFPSVPSLRPRAVSVASVNCHLPQLPRSRSAVDIQGHSSLSATQRSGFEPALETLVDERTQAPDQVPGSETVPQLDPPASLEQVIDEGEAFEHQRAQWKKQATRSIGNKHTRSISRARSKSLSERHARGHHSSEGSKAQFTLEFLAARTLLGSQSTMPTVHVTKPSSSSIHLKTLSHSHSHSAYSNTHTSHSHGYSHSHSHSLTTSNSSKSSRIVLTRGHSRTESWSKTALLRAGSLCGVIQDESYSISADEKVPSSSRADVPCIDLASNTTSDMVTLDAAKTHIPSGGQVGIAIGASSSPEACIATASPRHPEKDHRSQKHKHQSFEYAGPHPSIINSSWPQFRVVSDVSLRHRLPPRAAIHPPIAPIAHPYRSALQPPGPMDEKASEYASPKVTENQAEPSTERASYHLSLSHTDFERYGVGEALVYASLPSLRDGPQSKRANAESGPSPTTELSPSLEHSPSRGTLEHERSDGVSSGMNSPPSLTNSTIQMAMSAFDNPDDLDEFQDLFYRPHPTSRGRHQERNVSNNQVPADVRSSASNSPLTHLVRKLSEEVHGRHDPSRTPSSSIRLKISECQQPLSSESGTKFVFTDIARPSNSPLLLESSSQLHLSIQDGGESTVQSVLVVPEDVNSSYTASVLDSPWTENENDTFGCPIRHGQLEAATSPSPIQSPLRVSTHLSIQEDQAEDHGVFLSPLRSRLGSSVDAARSSYLTTSDMSQMSTLSDFPLPPSARPSRRTSILQTSSELTHSSFGSESHNGDTEIEQEEDDDDESEEPTGDVREILRVLRMTPRVVSYDSRRTTFGGSEDMDVIMRLHQADP